MGVAVAMVMEEPMAIEERVARLESDVSFIRADIADIKADMRGLRGEVNSLKTEVYEFKKEFYEFKTEVAKEFGRVRASIESLKLWMILTGIGSMASVVGLALTLARLLKYAT